MPPLVTDIRINFFSWSPQIGRMVRINGVYFKHHTDLFYSRSCLWNSYVSDCLRAYDHFWNDGGLKLSPCLLLHVWGLFWRHPAQLDQQFLAFINLSPPLDCCYRFTHRTVPD